MSKNVAVQAEIRRLRDLAAVQAGGAVLTNAERRAFLARAVRVPLAGLSAHDPLVSEWKVSKPWKDGEGEQMELWEDLSIKKPDPLKALEIDAKLAGDVTDIVEVRGLGAIVAAIRSRKRGAK